MHFTAVQDRRTLRYDSGSFGTIKLSYTFRMQVEATKLCHIICFNADQDS